VADNEFVSIKSLAVRLGMDRSHARRYVLQLGHTPHMRRVSGSGGQLTLCVTSAEADQIVCQRSEKGFLASTVVAVSDVGVFYVIQLVPDLDPKRLKLGFAESLKQRLSQRQTAAPTARVMRAGYFAIDGLDTIEALSALQLAYDASCVKEDALRSERTERLLEFMLSLDPENLPEIWQCKLANSS
jgi:hypothetical protein